MDIQQFYIAGVNYKKTEASVRGEFAINTERYEHLLDKASHFNIDEFFVLSTCNRTEIYGITPNENQLIGLLCSETVSSADKFREHCYLKRGLDAVEHLFNVAGGLDSQILGDYEIVGQIKQAAKFAKTHGMIGPFLERLVNTVLQSSKAIKSQTQLSGGTVSVSFAAVQFIRDNVQDALNKKIVLFGTGKIGRNTCKNLVDYLGAKNITLINRTGEKANELAEEMNLACASYDEALQHVQDADIVIVATNAEQPVITKNNLVGNREKLLIDLSIPNNIETSAKELKHITLLNVDDLSKINDETLQMRMAEIPKAKTIIAEHINEFADWFNMRKNVPVLKAAKQKLMDMHQCDLFLSAYPGYTASVAVPRTETIQKVINNMAVKMREQPQPGCNYIEAINDFITGSVN